METKEKAIQLPKGVKLTALMDKLKTEKNAAFDFQKRRHSEWNENYLLYRDKVQVNRLTQRHAVNVPLIKETVRTILPRIDEEPDIVFEDKGGDLDKQLIVNEMWASDFKLNNLTLVDYVDKKQVCLYGRSYKKLNWVDGKFTAELKDIFDLLIDPKSSPLDIETARYLVEPNIFRSVEEIVVSKKYDEEGKKKLEERTGDNKSSTLRKSRNVANKKIAEARNKRMQQLGDGTEMYGEIPNANNLEELTQHYTSLWDQEEEKFVRYVILMAGEDIILRAQSLKKELGVEFWPFEGWADDLENTDIWSDSVVDMIRTPNQIINIWLSQLIENRSLRNFGMNFYDSTIEGFEPEAIDPRPGGWYPLPGKPGEVYQRIDIPELQGTKEEIQYLVSIAEKASATGAVDKGVVEAGKRTLGEIELAVGKAEQRTTSMSKFYRLSWKKFTEKWYALYEANFDESEERELFKKNTKGNLVGKAITREDFISEKGYEITTTNSTERTADKIDKIQRLMAVKAEFPDNAPLTKAIQKRMISLADLTPEEAAAIEEFEAQKIVSSFGGGATPQAGIPGMTQEEMNPNVGNAMQQIDAMIAGASAK